MDNFLTSKLFASFFY